MARGIHRNAFLPISTRLFPPTIPFPFWKQKKYGLYKVDCGYSLHDIWTDVSFADIMGLCFTTPCIITQITIWGAIRVIHSGHLSNTGKQKHRSVKWGRLKLNTLKGRIVKEHFWDIKSTSWSLKVLVSFYNMHPGQSLISYAILVKSLF